MLDMQAVTKVYRTELVETHALRSLDLHVREGEFVAVTGPSGSGKTTFLNIAGLLETFTGDAPPGLRQNQRLGVRVLLDTREDVLMVERGPFLEQGGGRYAYVMDDDTAVRTPVQLGATSLSAVEIVSGAREGDRIVVSGSDQFDNAERVSIN